MEIIINITAAVQADTDYKAVHDLAPPYLSDNCLLVAEVGRHLRSADVWTMDILRTKTQFGDRSFAVAGPRVWNSLLAP